MLCTQYSSDQQNSKLFKTKNNDQFFLIFLTLPSIIQLDYSLKYLT